MSPSSNFQFYGLATKLNLQFYEWTCYTQMVEAPVGAADTGPDGAYWVSSSDRT